MILSEWRVAPGELRSWSQREPAAMQEMPDTPYRDGRSQSARIGIDEDTAVDIDREMSFDVLVEYSHGLRDGREQQMATGLLHLNSKAMAIVQALLALVSRSLGRITSAMFGWAVVALFGQTSGQEKVVLSALVAAAAAWPILLLGIAVPKIATFVLAFVPLPDWVPAWNVRLVWIALAAAVPLAIGITMANRRRKADGEPAVTRILRGFPITIGMAAAFGAVFVTAPALRIASIIRRRIDVQVPLRARPCTSVGRSPLGLGDRSPILRLAVSC